MFHRASAIRSVVTSRPDSLLSVPSFHAAVSRVLAASVCNYTWRRRADAVTIPDSHVPTPRGVTRRTLLRRSPRTSTASTAALTSRTPPTLRPRCGERVRWRVAALGREFHVFHLHGHRWRFNGRYDDSLVLGPSTTVTVDYVEDNPGRWLYHCHVTDHMMGGMVGLYVVDP
jgi:FtsP/CotA-like multicopper oxidase with cupredoxin domain